MGSQPGLLAVAREKMRTRHLALRTEHTYLHWLRRYLVFHGRRHPRDLGAPEVEQFLTHLAVHRKVSAATQNQALQALPPRAADRIAVARQPHPCVTPAAAASGAEPLVQGAVRKAGISQPASSHTLRHYVGSGTMLGVVGRCDEKRVNGSSPRAEAHGVDPT
jgi:hypothetical protein